MAGQDVGEKTGEEVKCVCPYCDGVIEMSAPWCQVCEVEIRFCVACEEPLPRDAMICPSCGAQCEE